jgi:uncharacterized protein YgbK (DUF1537 family)
MSARVVIVADDLTGAMDVAGPLADRGLATLAVANREGCAPRDIEDATVVSINADSRHLRAADASRCMHSIASELLSGHFAQNGSAQILIKKIDSTLRGNVVAETLALMDGARRSIAVVAPAFPGQKRTVRDGVVHVDGVALADTAFAKDALSPPPLQPLHLLFTRAAQRTVVQLMRANQMPQLLPPGERQILVFDAESDADLERIVRNLQHDLNRVLLVGSAGLAQAVARVCFPDHAASEKPANVSGRILVVVGSRAQPSAEQVRKLAQMPGAERFPAPDGLVAVGALAKSQAQVLIIQATANVGGAESEASEVAARLADGAAGLLAHGGFEALIVSGGDTAIAILQRLGQSAVRVIGTLLPGIPYSRITGPRGEVVLVTKAGGFGGPDTFHTIASRLRSAA